MAVPQTARASLAELGRQIPLEILSGTGVHLSCAAADTDYTASGPASWAVYRITAKNLSGIASRLR